MGEVIRLYLEGRDDELALLRTLLADCRRSRGSTVCVSSPAATGKSTLLTAFVDETTSSAALVLRAAGSRAESGHHMGVLNQLLHSAPGRPALAEAAARLLGPDRPATGDAWVRDMQLLWSACLAASKGRSLVIAVDDIHLTDGHSIEFLAFVARRLRSAGVLLVFTEPVTVPHAPSSLHEQCLRLPYHHHVRLGPLSPQGAKRMVERRLGVPLSASFAAACHKATGGNPLLLRGVGILRPIVEGALPGRLDTGPAYQEAVVSLVRRCSADVREVARGIAALGAHERRVRVEDLLGLDAATVRRIVGELEASGVLISGRFRHPAACAAVRNDTPSLERSRLHERAARLLREAGAPATTVARHIADACADGPLVPTGPWVPDVLREAARQVLAEDRVDLAAEYLRLACGALEGDPRRAEAVLELAGVEWRVDPVLAKRHLPELADALGRARLRGEHAEAAVRHLLWHGRTGVPEVAPPSGEPGSAAVRAAPSSAFALTLPMPLAVSAPSLKGLLLKRMGRAARPWPYAYAAGGSSVHAVAVGEPPANAAEMPLAVLAGLAADSTPDEAERILEAYALDDASLGALCSALLVLVYGEKYDRAELWSTRLSQEAASRPQAAAWRAVFLAVSAEVALRRGALPVARARARDALAGITPAGWGVCVGMPVSTLVVATTAMGDLDEAAALLRLPVPDEMFRTLCGPLYLYARGRYHAVTGGFRAALGDFLACGELLTGWGLDAPGFLPWRTDAAAAHLGMGDMRRARKLVDQQLALDGLGNSRALGVTLRLLAASSDVRYRSAILDEAIEVLQECGDRLELARALADLADNQELAGLPDQARTTARLAASMAREWDADPLLLRTVPPEGGQDSSVVAPGSLRAAADGIDLLSDAERRVAALAATGHTNREISVRLLITVSTVEQHLTRVYRKLGVAGRAQLPTRLLRSGKG